MKIQIDLEDVQYIIDTLPFASNDVAENEAGHIDSLVNDLKSKVGIARKHLEQEKRKRK
jgi:hypothetical protein